MAIRLRCRCGREIRVPDHTAGKRCRCPACRETLRIATPAAASPAPASHPGTPPPKDLPALPTPRRQSRQRPRAIVAIVAGGLVAAILGWGVWSLVDPDASAPTVADNADADVAGVAPGVAPNEASNDSPNDSPKTAPNETSRGPASLSRRRGGGGAPSDDPAVQIAEQFVAKAEIPDSLAAIKLVDLEAFDRRVSGPEGSAAAQVNGLKTERVLLNLGARSLESTPTNGAVRHWRVLGKTEYDGDPAVMTRYYSEPRPPIHWVGSESWIAGAVPLVSFDEFFDRAGTVFRRIDGRPGNLSSRAPNAPDANGFLPPRAGYLLLCFEEIDGETRLVDLVNPMGDLRLSRVVGELFLRDYRVTTFGGRSEAEAEPITPSIFGGLAPSDFDEGVDLDGLARFSRGQFYSVDPEKIEPLPDTQRESRPHRLHKLGVHVVNNSPRSTELLERFREDFPDDPGGDLATVSLAMMSNDLEIGTFTAAALDAAATRLEQDWPDPFLDYVRWLAADARGDQSSRDRLAAELERAGFVTSEYFRRQTEKAIARDDKDALLATLNALAEYWNPDRTMPTDRQRVSVRTDWSVVADQVAGIQRGLGPRRDGGGPRGPAGRAGRAGVRRGPPGADRGDRVRPSPRGANRNPVDPPPNFGQGNRRGAADRDRPAPPPIPPSQRVTVELTISGQFDVRSADRELAAALNVSSHRYRRDGNHATLTLHFAGPLQAVKDAIDFGTVERVESVSRTLHVTVP